MHPFHVYIRQYAPLSPEEWERVSARLEMRDWDMGELILAPGQICQNLYFLESGTLRFFRINEKGEDVSQFFTLAPYCFTEQRSFGAQTPSTVGIEVLEPSRIWQMPYRDAFGLLDQIPAWATFVRKLIMEVQYYTEEILVELQSMPPAERYAKMLTEQDPLLTKVPLKHLASYLGIAPQSLSRIRKKLSQGELS